jgi:serine/threonine protein kinase
LFYSGYLAPEYATLGQLTPNFGLARLFPDDQSHISTQIAGTIGYLAPEYATLGQLTPKVDVYSFGILLLEIVSGRKNIDSTLASNQIYLIKWVGLLV